ncbi:hypothetical protein BGZ63DRAFT_434048 [Mariannaea sp. PMI_226]|nr:hypothetical protein BGZ63DRAFT_434048 [Mariannaea sp. PMI_226]
MSNSESSDAPARDELIDDAKANIKSNLNPSRMVHRSLEVNGNTKWNSLSKDVRWQSESFEKDYSFAKYTTGSHTLGADGRTVIGLVVRSRWKDDTNGWFKMVSREVGSSTVTVEISSYKTQGCNWGVEAWTI